MLSIQGLKKTFYEGKGAKKSEVVAVNGISIDVEPGELYTFLGPSGCGKTTTLRCVAGLEEPDKGIVSVGDRVLYDSEAEINVPAHRRGLGMVFQSYAIWPHMNVYKNVAFPLTHGRFRDRVKRDEVRRRVARGLEAVKLGHLGDRPATDLSGGQQQRLALARALVMESPLLLLDEPLSNLDAKLREEMRFELKRLQRDLGITTLYVTHDQVEALAMSSKIAVMNEGNIEQIGPPREIYNTPVTRFVADFIGTSNFLEGEVTEKEGQERYLVETPQGRVQATSPAEVAIGDPVTISIRPEQIILAEGAPEQEAPGVWEGEIDTRAFLGDAVEHRVLVKEVYLRARSNPSVSLRPETKVTLTLPAESCALIPRDKGE